MLLRKRSVTLIEMMIGCALLAVLLTLVFGIWGQIHQGHKMVDDERDLAWERVKLEATLDQLLLKMEPIKTEKGIGFYTDSENALIFISRVGASVDGLFVDKVLCKLHCIGGDFVLDQWPDPQRHGVFPQQMKRSVLLKGAAAVEWSFFVPPNPKMVIENPKIGIGVDKDEQQAPTRWSSSWRPGYKKIPVLLRLKMKSRDKDFQYETYLPLTHYPLELSE